MKVSRQFAENFDLVVRHYALPPDEVEEAKAAAKRNLSAAEVSFAAMADRIRQQTVQGEESGPC
jgi:hypothetical protein